MSDTDTSPSVLAVRPGAPLESVRLRRMILIRHLLTDDPIARVDVQRWLDEQSPRRRDPVAWLVAGVGIGAVLGGALCGWLS